MGSPEQKSSSQEEIIEKMRAAIPKLETAGGFRQAADLKGRTEELERLPQAKLTVSPKDAAKLNKAMEEGYLSPRFVVACTGEPPSPASPESPARP